MTAAEMIAELDRLGQLPWSQEKFDQERTLLLALLGGDSRDGMLRAIAGALPMRAEGARIRGVLLDEGDPLADPLPDNPWRIRPGDSLVDGIDRVWDMFDAPVLVKALLERVIGLVLLESRTGAPLLGYLQYHERDTYEIPEEHRGKRRPPFDRRSAVGWAPFGDLSMFVGAAPSEAVATSRDWPLPDSLRALYRVHAGLYDRMWSLTGPDDLVPWFEVLDHTFPEYVDTEDTNEEVRSDQLLALFGYGDDRTDLIDIRDPDEPVVRAWGDGHLYSGAGEPILEWLERKTALIVKIAE